MSFCRFASFFVCSFICVTILSSAAFAQDRERVVKENTTRPTEVQQTQTNKTSRPTLTNNIVVQNPAPLVKKTGSSQPTVPVYSAPKSAIGVTSVIKSQMLNSIQSKLGIPYLYGSTGPNRYDCSGFAWTVFQEAGIDFTRSSARTLWSEFDPVEGDDRFKFGTLVFFNGLGHMGIVVDDKGFYHASSSKGITYSKFAGYWEKRIVGYRRIPIDKYKAATEPAK